MQHDGAYDGFDPSEFPSRSGGKAEAVQHIKQVGSWGQDACKGRAWGAAARGPIPLSSQTPLQTHNFKKVVMVGDGMTDFEARAPGGADAFIGCGACLCFALQALCMGKGLHCRRRPCRAHTTYCHTPHAHTTMQVRRRSVPGGCRRQE